MADAGLAALALELGRTFSEVPEGILRAAERRQLVVVALRDVVPFAAMVEAFHRLVMDHEISGLRRGERIWRELTSGVLDRGGLHALVRRIADLAGGSAYLVARDGRLVAASHPAAAAPPATRENSRPVEIGGTSWGTLVVDARRGQLRAAVLDRAPHVVALETAPREHHQPTGSPSPALFCSTSSTIGCPRPTSCAPAARSRASRASAGGRWSRSASRVTGACRGRCSAPRPSGCAARSSAPASSARSTRRC